MKVFNENAEWNQDFLASAEFKEFGELAERCMKALVAKGCSPRDVSHAFQNEITTFEIISVLSK